MDLAEVKLEVMERFEYKTVQLECFSSFNS